MTSGQGGNPPGGPYGPPPGWTPPGQEQPPTYAPAPAVSYGPPPGVPQSMERPVTVRAGLGAFIGSMVLGAVAQVVTLLNYQKVLDWTLANAGIQRGADPEITREAAQLGARFGIVLGFLFVIVYGLFVWFAWRGRNWARIVLWVLAGLGIISGVSGLAVGSPLPFLRAIGGFQTLLLLAAVIALALKPSNEWYRFRKWQRMTGQR